jgi:hypothetical protein
MAIRVGLRQQVRVWPVVDDALHDDGRSEPVHARQRGELLVAQHLVGLQVGSGDPDEIVRVAEESLGLADSRNRGQAALEVGDRGGVFPVHSDLNENLEAEADRGGVDDGAIAADHPAAFELAEPPMTRRHAEGDTVGELGDGEAPGSLQLRNYFAIYPVHVHDCCAKCRSQQKDASKCQRGERNFASMTDLLDLAPIAATCFAIPEFVPQLRKLAVTGDSVGVSWSWAVLTAIDNAAWIGYFTLARYWTALVPSSSATLLAGTMAVMLTRRGRGGRRPGVLICMWAAMLLTAYGVAGRSGLGTLLTGAFMLQVTPSIWTAYRAARPTGISAGTWLLILGELTCWLVYGLHESDPRLITLGASGVVASGLMLARLAVPPHDSQSAQPNLAESQELAVEAVVAGDRTAAPCAAQRFGGSE